MAQDAEHHVKCLVSLYNRARGAKTCSTELDVDDVNHGISFAELVSYIEDAKMDDLVAPSFKLSDLATPYSNRLEQLGTIVSGRIHSTKLKDRISSYFPDMEAHTQGREVVLIFNKDVGIALGKACEHDTDSDAVHLARAATIIRRVMFNKRRDFNGSFHAQCREQSVPISLLALVTMVVNGPNIKCQTSSSPVPQPALHSISASTIQQHKALQGECNR